MSLPERFRENIISQGLFTERDKLIVAVSGGVDSVVLCELCKQAGYGLIIAHCNFQLRGEESERDEEFVKAFADKRRLEVLVKKFDTKEYAFANKLSIQEAARELRYKWFDELAKEQSSLSSEKQDQTRVYLLTAHHADDNAETVMMNFYRGTGLHGLTGIPAKNDYIRRPLLGFTKKEILDFAKEVDLDFVEDSSNASIKYTRNLFRHEIIPAIEKVFPQVKENLQDNIRRFNEIDRLYTLAIGEIKKKLCKTKGNEIHIPIKQLMQYNNRALVFEIIRDFGFAEKQVDELIKLTASESGRYIQSATYRIIRHRHWLIISPASPEVSENITIEEGDKRISFGAGYIQIKDCEKVEPVSNNEVACLDANAINYPILLRKWKAGDYFYPLGMKKKKKLARFFIDQKLSKTDKEKIWVMEMNKKIIWVVGHRIDDRFRITDNTKKMLTITFTKRQTG